MTFHWDKLLNFTTGLGIPGADKGASAEHSLVLLEPDPLEAAYRSDWIVRKGIEIPAFDSTRMWRAWHALRAGEMTRDVASPCTGSRNTTSHVGEGGVLLCCPVSPMQAAGLPRPVWGTSPSFFQLASNSGSWRSWIWIEADLGRRWPSWETGAYG